MRCEMIQNSMSPLPMVRTKRRLSARASSTKMATATAAAIRQSIPHTPTATAMPAIAATNSTIVPNLGL